MVLLFVAAVLGVASIGRLWVGLAGLVGFGTLGVVAALTRPTARPVDAMPAIAATLTGAGALLLFRRAARLPPHAAGNASGPDGRVIDRRGLLVAGVAGAGLALIAGAAGNVLARRFRADASRAGVSIPRPVSAASDVGDAELSVPGLGPFWTSNDRSTGWTPHSSHPQ